MRLLHTMLRVGNLQRSIDFYTKVMGMTLLKTTENTEYKYSLAFVGYGSNPDHAELELTYNWGVESYDMGTAYGHLAIAVPDAYAACEKIRNAGGKVTREAGPVKGGSHGHCLHHRPRWLQSGTHSARLRLIYSEYFEDSELSSLRQARSITLRPKS